MHTLLIKDTGDGSGRSLYTTSPVRRGDCLLIDEPIVFASYEEERCSICASLYHSASKCRDITDAFTVKLRKQLTQVEDALANAPGIDDLDRARQFIRIAADIEHNVVPHDDMSDAACVADLCSAFDNDATAPLCKCAVKYLPRRYAPLLEMAAANESKVAMAVKDISGRSIIQRTLPAVTNSTKRRLLVRILSALNTNAHEMTDIRGSGVFPRASLCNHSCAPNANFDVTKRQIKVFAITDIQPHQRVTIDYCQSLMMPTAARRAALLASYQFVCNCSVCTGAVPDGARAFNCGDIQCSRVLDGQSIRGVVYAREKSTLWTCQTCNRPLTESERVHAINQESQLTSTLQQFEVDDADDDDDESMVSSPFSDTTALALFIHSSNVALSHPFIHELSPIFARPLERIVRQLIGSGNDTDATALTSALRLWRITVVRLGDSLHHDEAMTTLDLLAQCCIVHGNIADAQRYYRLAADIASVITGSQSSTTTEITQFAVNTPINVQSMINMYKRMKS